MAVTDLGLLGSGSATSAGTTLAVTNTSGATIPAGTLLVLAGVWDNTTSTTAPTISASASGGASWTARLSPTGQGQTTTAGSGIWVAVWTVKTTSSIAAGATITTLTSNQSAVKRVAAIRGLGGVENTLRGSAGGGGSTSGAPSAVTSGTALVAGDVVVGVVGTENGVIPTADSDTLNGSWSGIVGQVATAGVSNANLAVGIQYKEVTATGAQTYNPVGANDARAYVTSLVPTVVAPNSGAGTGSWSFAGTASGSTDMAGDGSGAWDFTGAAAGTAPATPANNGTGAGSWAFTGSASGSTSKAGTGTGSWTFTGAAAGSTTARGGSGTGSWAFQGAAGGTTARSGAAVGSWSFAGDATGSTVKAGSGVGSWSFLGDGSGVAPAAGAASGSGVGSWSFLGTAAGSVPVVIDPHIVATGTSSPAALPAPTTTPALVTVAAADRAPASIPAASADRADVPGRSTGHTDRSAPSTGHVNPHGPQTGA